MLKPNFLSVLLVDEQDCRKCYVQSASPRMHSAKAFIPVYKLADKVAASGPQAEYHYDGMTAK